MGVVYILVMLPRPFEHFVPHPKIFFHFWMVMFLALHPMEFIFLNSSYLREHLAMLLTLNQKLLKRGFQYHKLSKTFSQFYRQYYDSISKFDIGFKSLLRQGLSEPEFYDYLVNKLKTIVGSNNFTVQFIEKKNAHYKKIGYNINVL